MTQFRKSLPQLGGDFFLTDGGIETTLIFLEGLELPEFAAFDLLKRREGEAALRKYFLTYAGLAQRFGTGLILESATWRASADWGTKLGYGAKEMVEVNRRAIGLLEEIRNECKGNASKVVISGCLGPRGDGYNPRKTMSEKDAESYHGDQIQTFEDTAADMATAITMNYVEEAVGITRAAERAGTRRHLVHGGNGCPASNRADPSRCNRAGGYRDVALPLLLHDQLRSSHPFRACIDRGGILDAKNSWATSQRVTEEPRRIERIPRT